MYSINAYGHTCIHVLWYIYYYLRLVEPYFLFKLPSSKGRKELMAHEEACFHFL